MDSHDDENPRNEQRPSIPFASFKLLKEHVGRASNSKANKLVDMPCGFSGTSSSQPISADRIMKIARAKLLQYTQKSDVFSSVINSFSTDSGPASEAHEDVELALLLQASAQQIAKGQFDRATKLLTMCHISASPSGNPVQRIVFFFAAALQERLNREIPGRMLQGHNRNKTSLDLERVMKNLKPSFLSCQQQLPFCQLIQVTGTQAIMDSLASARKIHLIDFGLKCGSHWTILMQALADGSDVPLELLKITGAGTAKDILEGTGKWLSSFAETMNLPFSFKIVASDMKDLKEHFFQLDMDEAVAVYLDLRLWTLLPYPNHLEAFIRVIKNLNPNVVVVSEYEAYTNSPDFLDRFNETLFLFSSQFDCLENCMERDNENRMMAEEVFIRGIIQNIVATEGEERIYRHERINFWRALFSRFGMVEMELSKTLLCQAGLVVKRSSQWSSCTLAMDGKCLIVGWNGNPVQSLSAWKFCCN